MAYEFTRMYYDFLCFNARLYIVRGCHKYKYNKYRIIVDNNWVSPRLKAFYSFLGQYGIFDGGCNED